ncbi:MAG: DUF2909 domain-containing protein [Pseudomonadales bacterium]|nr:DUF2909 domain-containing protein [Pseudomonadales bacterium]
MLKVIIILLLIGVITSLFGGLAFMFKDAQIPDSKRTLYALGIRITLATALMLMIFYGLYTGQLSLNAPWHKY